MCNFKPKKSQITYLIKNTNYRHNSYFNIHVTLSVGISWIFFMKNLGALICTTIIKLRSRMSKNFHTHRLFSYPIFSKLNLAESVKSSRFTSEAPIALTFLNFKFHFTPILLEKLSNVIHWIYGLVKLQTV